MIAGFFARRGRAYRQPALSTEDTAASPTIASGLPSRNHQAELSPVRHSVGVAAPVGNQPTLLKGEISFDMDSVLVTSNVINEPHTPEIAFDMTSVHVNRVPELEWHKEPAEYTYSVNKPADHDADADGERREEGRGILAQVWRFFREVVGGVYGLGLTIVI
ncbi:uncharacterized protein H6S33_002417 [Morchella sextelata]|uniref:uncharacterized protein n=1 Tax=Morchella sextelata TaxID=1174677 RepID=UPI001D042A28|nr:uncharacterized protein H6S33_002417 [Morchella sextelata]KAH0607383.1 hypothetical protein H6S33_002417 [Morchella sextelata]